MPVSCLLLAVFRLTDSQKLCKLTGLIMWTMTGADMQWYLISLYVIYRNIYSKYLHLHSEKFQITFGKEMNSCFPGNIYKQKSKQHHGEKNNPMVVCLKSTYHEISIYPGFQKGLDQQSWTVSQKTRSLFVFAETSAFSGILRFA